MGEHTGIQWADKTWSPWRGCTKVSDGCRNCYAEKLSVRNPNTLGIWGPNGTRVLNADWDAPLRWNRQAKKDGRRRRVFPSLCDPFEDWEGCLSDTNGNQIEYTMHNARADLWDLIKETPRLTWQLLTKRPENIVRMWAAKYALESGWRPLPRPNVHLYTSVENQEMAEERMPRLLHCRELVPVLGLSLEPLLGPIDLLLDGECSGWHCAQCGSREVDPEAFTPENDVKQYKCDGCGYVGDPGEEPDWRPLIDHVIVGGESGPYARPCQVDWIRDIVKQCRDANVACFVKQLGAAAYANGHERIVLNDSKGGDPWEWPEELRTREMPESGFNTSGEGGHDG